MHQLLNLLPIKIRECSICNQKTNWFKPFPKYYRDLMAKHGFSYKLKDFETLNLRDNTCPNCGAGDVNRLIALYLKNKLPKNKYKILDIAPIPSLTNLLKSLPHAKYRSVDLYMEEADDKADICDMDIYKDGQFSLVICSHVLEHVENDTAAIKEIFRVLSKGGQAIFMVPIMTSLDRTLENKAHTSEADRWKHYGQGDHVRLYSKKDFTAKIVKAGFTLSEYTVTDFGADTFFKYGIEPKAVLYVASKSLNQK